MAVGADQGLAGLAKALQMYLMADTVTGTGEVDTMFCCNGLQITMVISVFKAALERVMVYVSNTQLCLDSGDTHGFKFQIGHGAGGILRQSLIDAQCNLTARGHIT